MLPLDVPDKGLTPDALLNTYNVGRLAADGYTGKGTTIVFFAFDGFDQSDLDTFATTYGLPQFTPEVVGGRAGRAARRDDDGSRGRPRRSHPMRARSCSAPSRRSQGDGAFEKIGEMFDEADRQFPGAVWSFSIGWGCDKLITAADLAPVRSALGDAHSRTAPRRSTPAATSPGWNARAATTGRLRRAQPISGWIRSPRCRR